MSYNFKTRSNLSLDERGLPYFECVHTPWSWVQRSSPQVRSARMDTWWILSGVHRRKSLLRRTSSGVSGQGYSSYHELSARYTFVFINFHYSFLNFNVFDLSGEKTYDCKYNNVINMILMLAQKKIFIDETA